MFIICYFKVIIIILIEYHYNNIFNFYYINKLYEKRLYGILYTDDYLLRQMNKIIYYFIHYYYFEHHVFFVHTHFLFHIIHTTYHRYIKLI